MPMTTVLAGEVSICDSILRERDTHWEKGINKVIAMAMCNIARTDVGE